jgi:hypothetical protein
VRLDILADEPQAIEQTPSKAVVGPALRRLGVPCPKKADQSAVVSGGEHCALAGTANDTAATSVVIRHFSPSNVVAVRIERTSEPIMPSIPADLGG